MRYGLDNPAHYRLMFCPALASPDGLPAAVSEAAAGAKEVPRGVVLRGAREGRFAADPDAPAELNLAVLTAWSLALDGLATGGTLQPLPEHVAMEVSRTLLHGVRRR